MRKILVLKLTRMGDILEAAPLFRAIRMVEPSSRVTLVVNETFRDTAELLADVDEILSFPIFEYARDLREGDRDLVDLYQQLEAFADRLSADRYDLALNVTNSQLSGMLMGFVKARQARGLSYDGSGARLVVGPFVRYFGANDIRRLNPFNLSDFMLRLYGGPGIPCDARLNVPAEAVARAEAWLEPTSGRPLVGVQLGASEPCKRWRLEDFSRAAALLLEQSEAALVVVGSPSERPLAEALRADLAAAGLESVLDARFVDLVGRTSIPELAAVTGRMQVLVSNDTGTMHLAAALGVRVLNLSLGSAYYRETAPYGEGHLILEPRIACRPCNFRYDCPHFDCKRLLSPATVAALTLALMRGDDGMAEALEAQAQCDVLRTTFDEDGLLDHALLVPRPLTADEVLNRVLRIAICQGELGGDFEVRLENGMRRLLADGTSIVPGESARLLAALTQLRRAEALAEAAAGLMDEALDAVYAGEKHRVEEGLERISAIDAQLSEVGSSSPDCRLLLRALVLDKEAIRAERLEMVLHCHRASYLGLKTTAQCGHLALSRALALLEAELPCVEEAPKARTDAERRLGP